MNRASNRSRAHIIYCMLFALLFNSIGSLYASASMLSHAQSFSDQDTVLICTGTTYKWVSVSVYQQTGQITFVEPPEHAPTSVAQVSCSYAYIGDTSSPYYLLETPHLIFNNPIDNKRVYCETDTNHPNPKYRLTFPRAPPVLS